MADKGSYQIWQMAQTACEPAVHKGWVTQEFSNMWKSWEMAALLLSTLVYTGHIYIVKYFIHM
jgi:hypothetical protein